LGQRVTINSALVYDTNLTVFIIIFILLKPNAINFEALDDSTLKFKCSNSSMKLGLQALIETTHKQLSKWNETIIIEI